MGAAAPGIIAVYGYTHQHIHIHDEVTFMRKHSRITALIAAALLISFAFSGCLFDIDNLYIEDPGDPGPYSTDSTYTLMVYLCGSDLESSWGCGTADLREMIEGYNGNECVNIIVQTGGAYLWHNLQVSGDRCQRFRVTRNTIETIEDTVGDKPMSDDATLTDFINFSVKEYPADRYGLVLWNHGGGSAGGFGYDERHGDDMMSMTDFDKALRNAGVTFDFIGFDACLMGGYETCLTAAPYTKYLIASQESEPGCGWYYTDWIRALSKEPSSKITDLGKIIIDNYIEKAYEYDPATYSTLGLFDTEKVVSKLLPVINEMSMSYSKTLTNGDFKKLSKSRSELREMVSEEDYVDLYSVAESDKNDALKAALAESTVYFSSTSNGTGDNGLSIYYPYHDLSHIDQVNDVYEVSGYDTGFDDFISLFANIMACGQILLDDGTEESEFEDCDWFSFFDDTDSSYDESFAKYGTDYYNNYSENSGNFGELEIKEKDGEFVLPLTDEEWENIADVTLTCIADYGDMFVDFGEDDLYEFNDSGDLVVGYDRTWVALDGCIVPFYYESSYETDDYFLTSGYVPCMYNEKEAEIVVAWDTDHPEGYVAGVRMVYENNMISSKGMAQPEDGDKFSPRYDVYDEDMNFVKTVTLDDEVVTVNGDIKVSYEDVTDQLGDTYVYYTITDIFGNESYTQSVEYKE